VHTFFSPQVITNLVVAVVVLGLAIAGIAWFGHVVRGELGRGASRAGGGALAASLEMIPPALMKEAIARGMVSPSQLAAMSDQERTFLLASLKQKLAADSPSTPERGVAQVRQVTTPAAPGAPAAVAPATPAPATPAPATPAPATPALPADLPPAMQAMLSAERLRVWCPMCGTELQLPTFPPMVARCAH
jgi:hypothetical protein